MPDERPYARLLAKGEERRERILTVARGLLTRNGWRNTSLAQVARAAGVSQAGLLHHFESKEQLLHAVLEQRDLDDLGHADLTGDVIAGVGNIADRFTRSPELVGVFIVLLVENLEPDAPLHDRLLNRYRAAVRIVADAIERGQRAGRYRADVDPVVKATEILAFINGMETSWLLDPSIPLTTAFQAYTQSLARQLMPEATC
jgi:AcrR family transcriptional regulator